jgi:TrpR-related protein YerC/YecD
MEKKEKILPETGAHTRPERPAAYDKPEVGANDPLFEAILQLRTVEECHAFFEDLCTIKEIQDLAQRYAVATMLRSGWNYQEVSRATGASTATICRVNKCLNYGRGGYRTVLDRVEDAAPEANEERESNQ